MKLIPMYRIDAVVHTWPVYTAGVEAILNQAGHDVSMEKIYNEIMAKELLLWVGYMDEKYIGFCTTRIDRCPTTKSFVSIIHAYGRPGISLNVFMEAMETLEAHAKEFNCHALRFWTRRDKAFERRLTDLGWTQSYAEFLKEVA